MQWAINSTIEHGRGQAELEANRWVEGCVVSHPFALSLDVLCEINSLVRALPHSQLRTIDVAIRGRFALYDVKIPRAEMVPLLLAAHVEWQGSHQAHELPLQVRTALAGLAIAAIHPFVDGNGRTMRVAMSGMLLSGGLSYSGKVRLSDWFNQERRRYLTAVLAGVAGEPGPFARLVSEAVSQLMRVSDLV